MHHHCTVPVYLVYPSIQHDDSLIFPYGNIDRSPGSSHLNCVPRPYTFSPQNSVSQPYCAFLSPFVSNIDVRARKVTASSDQPLSCMFLLPPLSKSMQLHSAQAFAPAAAVIPCCPRIGFARFDRSMYPTQIYITNRHQVPSRSTQRHARHLTLHSAASVFSRPSTPSPTTSPPRSMERSQSRLRLPPPKTCSRDHLRPHRARSAGREATITSRARSTRVTTEDTFPHYSHGCGHETAVGVMEIQALGSETTAILARR